MSEKPGRNNLPVASSLRRKQLLSTSAAAQLLGLSDAQFRRLAARQGLQPEEWYDNPYYRSAPACPLWPLEPVQALVGGPEVAAARERSRKLREGRDAAPQRRRRALEARYGPRWALGLSAVIFAVLHGANPNADHRAMAGLVVAGVYLGAAYLFTRRLFAVRSMI